MLEADQSYPLASSLSCSEPDRLGLRVYLPGSTPTMRSDTWLELFKLISPITPQQ